MILFIALPSGSVDAAAPALRELRLLRLAARRTAPGRAIGPPLEAKDTRSALGVLDEQRVAPETTSRRISYAQNFANTVSLTLARLIKNGGVRHLGPCGTLPAQS